MLAVITAYVRSLGAAVGAGQFFLGPMAKQHRMGDDDRALSGIGGPGELAGAVDAGRRRTDCHFAGCLVTIARRSVRIVSDLESR